MSYPNIELGSVTEIRTGKLDANASVEGGQFPFFTCSKNPLRIDNYSFDGEYVLVAGNGDLNVKHYIGKFDAYQRTYAIKSDQSQLYTKYLYYFLSKYVEVLRNLSIGGVIKYIKLGNLTEAKVPLPSLAEQQKIAAILDVADQLRQKDQLLIDKYNALSQALFLDMFGDPKSNPRCWSVIQLQDVICDGPQNGLYKPSKEYGGGCPIVRIDSFFNDVVKTHSLKRIRASEDEMNKFEVAEGDFLINRVNSPSHLGKCGLMPKINERMVFESNMMRIKFDRGLVSNMYMLYILSSRYLKNQILNSSKDAVNQSSINQKDVNSFSIPLPPITLQNQFAERIQAIEAQKQQAQASLQKSEVLFNSLLQRAFKGELTA
ncbi:restriction endonuclease subunit S [Pseudomonadota bacterium]